MMLFKVHIPDESDGDNESSTLHRPPTAKITISPDRRLAFPRFNSFALPVLVADAT